MEEARPAAPVRSAWRDAALGDVANGPINPSFENWPGEFLRELLTGYAAADASHWRQPPAAAALRCRRCQPIQRQRHSGIRYAAGFS